MSDDLVLCPKCDTENPSAARFCMGCGASLEINCPNCSTELPSSAKFCFSCGHEIEVGSTAEEVGQSAQAVTDDIAERLLEATAAVGERRTITMLFCDVKDSTATAELLDPEAWSEIMRDAMATFVSSVERYGGTVARLLGDAVLAYFGAPVAHEDDPQRAILASLAIVDGFADLGERVRNAHGTEFNVRVGINTGLVVVGQMGSAEFGEYAALGDAANVAARMEQTADPGTVRIAEPTYRLVAPLFETEPVGHVEVKGRQDPIAAYRVLSAKGQPGQVRGISGLEAPMVGRDAELSDLSAALHAVTSGSGRIVSIKAEAGLGKSRLASELRAVTGDSVRWITGQCYSYEDTTPYAPFIPALIELLGIDQADAPTQRSAHAIEALLEILGDSARQEAVFVCTMLGLPLELEDQKSLSFFDPGTLRSRVFGALTELLANLAKQKPLVLELEDLHWADPTSIDLIEHALPLADTAPIMILLLFRPRRDEPPWRIHEMAERDFGHRYSSIELAPLSAEDSRALVGHLLRVEGLSSRVRDTILAKAEGNPFFVEEVIRSLLDAGTIVRDGDNFVATEDIHDIAVPDTLAAVLATRLDRLAPEARKVMQTASVIGRDFSHEMLGLLSDPEADLDGLLTDLQRRELVLEKRRDPELVFTFKHALTRDTAYDTLLLSVRRDLHRIMGKLLEERHPDQVFDLARHFGEADDPAKAVPYMVAAGDAAFAAFARDDAADYFRTAVNLWDDGHDVGLARKAFEGLGNAQLYLGQIPESLATFDEMLTFARDHGDVVGEISALNKRGFVTLVGTGDTSSAEEQMLEAKSLAEDAGEQAGIAEFHVGYCVLNVSRGRLDHAEEHLGEAAEVCFTLDSFHRNFGLTHYGATLIYQVRFDEARVALARAREQAAFDEDLEHVAEAQADEALIDLFCGAPAVGGPKATEATALANRIGSSGALIDAAWIAGMCAQQLGEFEQAAHFLRMTVDASVPTSDGRGAAALVGLAMIESWIHGHGSSTVAELFEEARAMADSPIGMIAAASLFSAMGLEYLIAGSLDDAQDALDQASHTPSATSRMVNPELLLCRAGIALGRGDTSGACDLYQQAWDEVQTFGVDLYRSRALLGLGIVANINGDKEGMRDFVEQAEADAGDRSMKPDQLLIQRTGIQLLDQAGLDASGLKARASDTVAELAANFEDADLRRAFLKTNSVVS